MIEPLLKKALNQLVSNWIPILLISGIAWVVGYSMAAAKWVRNDTLIPNSVLLGLLFGWLLSISRFRGKWVAAYSFVLSFLYLGVALARLLPAIQQGIFSQVAFPDVLDTLNIRLWTLFYRVSAWATAIRNNTTVGDTGFFVYLLSLILWNVFTWFVWCCLRTHRTYAAIILVGFLLAFNIQLSGQGLWELWFYLLLALMLVVRTEYLKNQYGWDDHRIDYPEDIGYDLSGVALGLSTFITCLAVACSTVGTREGLRMLADMLTVPREKTADTAEKLFSGVTPPKSGLPAIYVRTPDLQNFSSALPEGKDVIMWVRTSDPPPPPLEAHATVQPVKRYWRSKVYTAYTQTGWKLLPDPDQVFVSSGESPPPTRSILKQEFNIQARNDQWLFASNFPVQMDSGGELLQDRQDTDTVLLTGKARHYLVTSWIPAQTTGDLQEASTDYSPEIRERYLQLPAGLPGRVRSLTDQITAGAATPYEIAARIQNYLRATYRYDLKVPKTDPDQDFVDTFLFETQAGYCTHFASAMVVMLRLEGVPARVVAGYSTGEYDTNLQAYRVTADAAHAWVEVYFPGTGWVEFEPTPSQSIFRYGQDLADTASIPEQIPAQELSRQPVSLVGVTGAIILALFVGLAVWGIFLRVRSTGGDEASRLYWSVRGSFLRAGIPSTPATTPDEFLLTCQTALSSEGRLMEIAQAVTSLYVRSVFSPSQPSYQEISSVRRKWEQALGRWLMYAARHRFQMTKQTLIGLVNRRLW